MHSFVFAALAIIASSNSAAAQGKAATARFFQPDSLRRLVEVLAHDSLVGRATPSPGLDKAAGIISAEFARNGVTPFGDDNTFLQKYPVVMTSLDSDSTRITIGATQWTFGTDFFYGGGAGTSPFGELRSSAAIASGNITSDVARTLGLQGKVVLYLPVSGTPRQDVYRSVFALGGAGVVATIVAGRSHDSTWAQLKTDLDEFKPMTAAGWPVWTTQKPPGHVHFIPILELWRGRFRQLLDKAGIDSASLWNQDQQPKVTLLASEAVLSFPRRIRQVSWPANVVGVVTGGDPRLRHEYVVVTAHYDGLGVRPGFPPAMGTLNGADDNASGTAALIRMAQAMASGSRPRRSVIFAAVSGEELGLWGSDYLASRPPVPRAQLVANINMDMVGRAKDDSVYAFGLADSTIGPVARRALAGSPELRLLNEAAFRARFPNEPIDDRSDHANFRRRGIPYVYFFTGWHEDYHNATDDATKVNFPGLSKITRAAFDVTLAIANADIRR